MTKPVYSAKLGRTNYYLQEQPGGHICIRRVNSNGGGDTKMFVPRALIMAYARAQLARRVERWIDGVLFGAEVEP